MTNNDWFGSIRSGVNTKVFALRANTMENRATISTLRRQKVSQPPTASVFKIIIDPSAYPDGAGPSRDKIDRAVYAALVLFARQSKLDGTPTAERRNVGAALAQIRASLPANSRSNFDRRASEVFGSSSFQTLTNRLARVLSFGATSLNYGELAADLYSAQDSAKIKSRLYQWGQTYHRSIYTPKSVSLSLEDS